jgi:triacylglycerol lipase
MRHHVYFSPGMFGFGKLGSYTYFTHVQRELTARFAAASHELCAHVIEDLPTASIRRRSTRLAEVVQRTATGTDPIHLLGHSTGGLDARLVASPSTTSIPADLLGWLPRLRTITTMNTPHYGTPLASFFATSNGQRVLAALSMLTVAGLTLGATPLRATSVLLGFLQRGDLAVPFKLLMLDRAVESVVGMVDDAGTPEVRSFLAAIEDDQGSMLQLSPESMDLVVAGFEDRSGVRYQATASMSPAPTPQRWVQMVGHPIRALSLSIFYALHRVTATTDKRYPCHAHDGGAGSMRADHEAQVTEAFGRLPVVADNDGVVPFRSQLWGTLVWSGLGDHLDVLGHYRGARDEGPLESRHHDWLTSGSEFSDRQFGTLMDAVAAGMLA